MPIEAASAGVLKKEHGHGGAPPSDDGFELAAGRYRALLAKRVLFLGAMATALAASLFADLVTGPSGLGASAFVTGILHPGRLDATDAAIIWNVRLPYAVMAALVGSALALSGAEMQTILDNPLASPFTLGVSSAAALGAAAVIVCGFSATWLSANWSISLGAFVAALASVMLLQFMARLKGAGVEMLVLLGIALVFSCNALVALLQLVATEDILQQIEFWSLGSVARANWQKIGILAAVMACAAPFSLAAAKRMTALRLGEERARSFGINVRRLRLLSLVRISLISATAVAFVGTIGFVGLVGPHIARLLVGEDQRFLLPTSALAGALLLSLASVASKIILPGVIIPVGIVTTLVGVPIFVVLVFSRGRQL